MAARLRRIERVEQNREVVLDAAKRVFVTRGYAGATVDAIADEAGFSKGVVYSQFGSKADLFFALLDRRIDARGAQNERIAAELAGAEGLREFLRVAMRDAATDEGWARLLVEFRSIAARDPELNRRYGAAHGRTVDRLAGVLEILHTRGGLEPAFPLRSMAEFILALGAGATLERAANPAALPEDDLLAMLPTLLGLTEIRS